MEKKAISLFQTFQFAPVTWGKVESNNFQP